VAHIINPISRRPEQWWSCRWVWLIRC